MTDLPVVHLSRCTIIADFSPEGLFTALESRTAPASLHVNHGRTVYAQNTAIDALGGLLATLLYLNRGRTSDGSSSAV